MRKIPAILRVAIAALALAVSGRAGGEATSEEVSVIAGDWPAMRDATFEAVWKTVNEAYYDPTFGGVDWAAVGMRYREKLPQVEDKPALRELLQAMLGELGRSHFAIQPREMAVFTPEERSRAGTLGAEVAWVEGRVAVVAVEPDSPASQAGLAVGDVVKAVGELELAPLAEWLEQTELTSSRRRMYLAELVQGRLRGPVGKTTRLLVSGADGQDRPVELVFADHPGVWSEPMGDFPSLPVVVRSRCDPDGLAYLRFNVFARAAMKDIRALLRQVPPDGGLIIDLRGNGGGLTMMASGISGWLSDRTFSMGTMHMRQGHLGFTVTPQAGAFLGPVAVLIDNGSASTSEIMAAGLQEAGRARLFGEPSPGAALSSLFKALPTGDLLQYAIADMQTPRGRLIEGQGVTPDEPVERRLADLTTGDDAVVAAARRWLQEQRKASGQPSTAP